MHNGKLFKIIFHWKAQQARTWCLQYHSFRANLIESQSKWGSLKPRKRWNYRKARLEMTLCCIIYYRNVAQFLPLKEADLEKKRNLHLTWGLYSQIHFCGFCSKDLLLLTYITVLYSYTKQRMPIHFLYRPL